MMDGLCQRSAEKYWVKAAMAKDLRGYSWTTFYIISFTKGLTFHNSLENSADKYTENKDRDSLLYK